MPQGRSQLWDVEQVVPLQGVGVEVRFYSIRGRKQKGFSLFLSPSSTLLPFLPRIPMTSSEALMFSIRESFMLLSVSPGNEHHSKSRPQAHSERGMYGLLCLSES